MFNINSIGKSEYRDNSVSVKGKAVSSSNDLEYGQGGLEAYFESIPEVATVELISYKNYPGGGSNYSVLLTPAEDVTIEQLIEEVPKYQPVDKDGNLDTNQISSGEGFQNLNIVTDGKGLDGRNRVDMYNQGV